MRGFQSPALLLALLSIGCHGADESALMSPAACAPPNRMVGDRCLEPAVQDDGCPAGTRRIDDGACLPAGIPPELCAVGFEPDGNMGCEPVLPPMPCPSGLMAVPGQSTCRPVTTCAPGIWGDIPVDATTIYVDDSYTGGDADGTAAKPWPTVGDAVFAASSGVLIAIAAGTYVEDISLAKPLRLRGVCAEAVELVGTAAKYATIFLGPGSSGTTIGGVGVTGDSGGILMSGAENVVIEDVWVHDLPSRGIDVEIPYGPTSATVRRSLIERSTDSGLFFGGATASVTDVVVRATVSNALGASGLSIRESAAAGVAATVHVQQSVIEQNAEVGLGVYGSEAIIEGVVIRETMPRAVDQDSGRGVSIASGLGGVPLATRLRSSLIERNHDVGIVVAGADATFEGVTVRSTAPRLMDQQNGFGIVAQPHPETGVIGSLSVHSSRIEQNHGIGAHVIGYPTAFEGVVVRATLPQKSDQLFGRGLNFRNKPGALPASVQVRSSLVESNRDVAVFVGGIDATIEGTAVRDTSPRAHDQAFGMGIAVHYDPEDGAATGAILRSSLVDGSFDVGVMVIGVHTTVEALLVRNTMSRMADGLFGDGVVAESRSENAIARADVSSTRIEHNRRAGVASFGAEVSLTQTVFACNAIDLNGEPAVGLSYSIDDRGGNSCGCPEADDRCALRSAQLAPPEAPVGP